MAIQGLVPLLSRAMTVTGTIWIQSAKVRLKFKCDKFRSLCTQVKETQQQLMDCPFEPVSCVGPTGRPLYLKKNCKAMIIDISMKMKLHFLARPTMTGLEATDSAALKIIVHHILSFNWCESALPSK